MSAGLGSGVIAELQSLANKKVNLKKISNSVSIFGVLNFVKKSTVKVLLAINLIAYRKHVESRYIFVALCARRKLLFVSAGRTEKIGLFSSEIYFLAKLLA